MVGHADLAADERPQRTGMDGSDDYIERRRQQFALRLRIRWLEPVWLKAEQRRLTHVDHGNRRRESICNSRTRHAGRRWDRWPWAAVEPLAETTCCESLALDSFALTRRLLLQAVPGTHWPGVCVLWRVRRALPMWHGTRHVRCDAVVVRLGRARSIVEFHLIRGKP